MKVITNPRFIAEVGPGITVTSFAQVASWFASTTPRTIATTWSTDDVVVVCSMSENGDFQLNAPTVTGLSFTQRANLAGTGSQAETAIWTSKAASSSSGDISMSCGGGGSGRWGFAVYVLSGASDYSGVYSGFSNATQSLTNAAGDITIAAVNDFNAVGGGMAGVAGSGSLTERVDVVDGTAYAGWIGDWLGASSGSNSYGISSYTSRSCGQCMITVAAA